MKVVQTSIQGLLLIEPRVYGDQRGFFAETYHRSRYHDMGITEDFVQDNLSRSTYGVLRGLHFQTRKPQGKLVRCARGEVYDVAVDLRAGSSTYGQWESVILSETNHRQLYIPPGFAHGFCTLSESADFVYKCTEYYDPDFESGLRWNDPDLKIAWPIEHPVLSVRDQQWPSLSDIKRS